MQNNLLSDFFSSNSELSVVDHFMQLMVKTNTFDDRLKILQQQLKQSEQLHSEAIQQNKKLNDNVVHLQQLQDSYQIEIEILKKQLQEHTAKFPLLNNQLKEAQLLQKQSVQKNELLSKKIADLELINSINNQDREQSQFSKSEVMDTQKNIQNYDVIQSRKRSLSSYKELSYGVWTDPDTGLMWARISIGQTWQNGRCQRHAKKISWFDAEAQCKKFRLGGYSSWRLPNSTELKTLMMYKDEGYNCPEGFLSKPTENDFGSYWSCETGSSGKSYRIEVNFQSGVSHDSFHNNGHYVRAVRSA